MEKEEIEKDVTEIESPYPKDNFAICNINHANLCSEKYCDRRFSHLIPLNLANKTYLIPLCQKHFNELKINFEDMRPEVRESESYIN